MEISRFREAIQQIVVIELCPKYRAFIPFI